MTEKANVVTDDEELPSPELPKPPATGQAPAGRQPPHGYEPMGDPRGILYRHPQTGAVWSLETGEYSWTDEQGNVHVDTEGPQAQSSAWTPGGGSGGEPSRPPWKPSVFSSPSSTPPAAPPGYQPANDPQGVLFRNPETGVVWSSQTGEYSWTDERGTTHVDTQPPK